MNFAQALEKDVKLFPNKPAIIFKSHTQEVSSEGVVITYKQLNDFSLQVAKGLSSLGVLKGEKIAIFLPNIPEYIYSFLGVFVLRGVCVPLDFMLTEEEIINFINHSDTKVLIAQERRGLDFNNLKSKCPKLQKIVVFNPTQEAFLSWNELLNKQGNIVNEKIDELDESAIFYTSGSTGHPKGVMLNYGHLGNPIKTLEYFLKVSEKDSFLCAGVPFSHVGGLDYMLFMLYFGTTLVLMERFQPLDFLKNIEKYKLTIFCIVPSMYVAVLSLKDYDKFDLSSLRYAVVFGAPSSPVLLERFHKVCPNAYLLNGWGMTETAAPNTFLPTGTNTREIEHTGKFPPGTEVKIVDLDGNELKGELEGELWIKGKAVTSGYYKEPELTKSVLTADGWFKTGDVVKRDKGGRYSIVGRIKEMIKVAGEIVFAPELEEVIQRHPKVKEAAVIGIPDKLRGEVPKAFITPKEGEELADDEMRSFLKQHLAHFKIPHYFEFSSTLPKNRVGKIDKESLKRSCQESQKIS
ncbi:MAG: class I adenylate-forming enzyme family protein [Candidatus Omnitrophica bacterium]|nr:class I adenylate-forming enzyme family protein [Candidatus Omnitrophota bacterium]